MSIIISDKDKLIQDLYKKMTKVTDIYSTTHKVVHWGDVQAIVEKFFMDKNSDWLMAKTEPTCSKMEHVEDDAYFLELMGAVERGEISDAEANQAWYEYINHKDEPQTERGE